MRFPAQLMWGIIGDAFERAYDVESKRPVELLWQTMNGLSGQAVEYADSVKRARSVFTTDLWAPYGTFYTMPTLVDISARLRGIILGHRNGEWIALIDENSAIPSLGRFTLLDASVDYGGGTTIPLLSPHREAQMTTTFHSRPWDENNNPSYVFSEGMLLDGSGRWADEGTPALTPTNQGLLFRPQDSNWSILKDQFHMSGAEDWEQIWRIRIDRWDASNAHDRAISLFSFGDSGASYEVRIRDTGATIQCSSGMYAKLKYTNLEFDGNTVTQSTHSFYTQGFRPGMILSVLGSGDNDGDYLITNVDLHSIEIDGTFITESHATASLSTHLEPMQGSTFGLRNLLLSASEHDPIYIEIVLRYDAHKSEMSSIVFMGERVMTGEGIVSPGRRHQDFAVFNQVGDVQLVLEWVGVPKGVMWNASEVIDLSTSIGESLGWVYVVPEPLTDSSRLSWGPYDLASNSDITFQDAHTIRLTVPEDFVEYAPEFCRIVGPEGHIIGERQTQNGSDVEYRIISASEPGLKFKGSVTLHPWFLDRGEFEWIATHTFSTRIPLPFNRRSCFFTGTRGEEMELYGRFGKVLGMPERPDSKEYLDSLRGMEYALRNRPTPVHMSRAVGIMLGAPYSMNGGFINEIVREVNALGAPTHDLIYVGDVPIESNPQWRDLGHILPIGSFVQKMEPIASPVRVYDWMSNTPLIQSRVDPWKTWSTFILQIPAVIGMSTTKGRDLARMISRSKDVHTQFLVEFIDSLDEAATNEDALLGGAFIGIAHTLEDLIWDDGGEVVSNPLNFQADGGVDYSEEWQLPDPLSLDSGHHLDQHGALGMASAAKFDLIKIQKGLTLNMPQDSYHLRNAAIDLTREITADEAALDLSRRSMRASAPNGTQGYFCRPYSLCFPLTGASPKWSVRDGGGMLYSYHTQTWASANPSNSQDLHDVHIHSPNLIWAVGTNGAIWETTNYGETWTSKAITTSETFNATSGEWAVGTSGIAYRRTAGVWSASNISSSTYDFVDIFFIGQHGWAIANNSGACYCYRTSDGGDTWSGAIEISNSDQAACTHFISTTVGWVGTDGGLFKTTDGGLTWSAPTLDTDSIAAVAAASLDIVIVTTDQTHGRILRSTDGGDNFDVMETLSSAKLTDVSFIDTLRGSAVGTSGSAYDTNDGGETWTVVSIPNEDWSAIDCAYPWFKIAVGPNAGTNDVVRWK